jgi:hypothetical protein
VGQPLRKLRSRARVEQRKVLFLADGRGCHLRHSRDRNIARVRVRRNGRAGPVFPVPTSPSIRTLQRQNLRKRVQSHSGVRVSLVPCIPLRRAQPQSGKLPREHRRKVGRSTAGRNPR